MKINELMVDENLHLDRLRKLVADSIKEEELLSSKLIAAEQDQDITFGQSLADKIAEFGGSWTFILSFFIVIFFWITVNIFYFKNLGFDPYPYILLNLILSCLAALQAPVIMMSQNRQEDKDRRRARNDYLVNLKAEIEVRNLHSKVDLLITEQMKSLFEIQKQQLAILQKVEQELLRQK
jgi:uncharacterized membrane protein